MKLSSIILMAVLGTATQVLSAPPLLFKRQASVVSVLDLDVTAAISAMVLDIRAINSAVSLNRKNVSAQAELIVAINAGYADITTQLKDAYNNIRGVTASAPTTVVASDFAILNQLVQNEYALVYSVKNLVTSVTQRVTTTTRPAIKQASADVLAALPDFLWPLSDYAGRVTQVPASNLTRV